VYCRPAPGVVAAPFRLLASFVVAGLAAPALAHHSDATYELDRIVAFEGQVTRYAWRNPHVMISVETETETGETVEWLVETGSTPIMSRSGWSRDLLSPGDTVTVRLHPERRSGRAHGILNVLETADGRTWSQIETDAVATGIATSIEGVWRGLSSSSLNAQLRETVLTPAAETARANYNDVLDRPTAQCIPNPPPMHVSSNLYLSGVEILDDRVMLRNEILDVERTVYTDGREHPENGERTNQGHSIGGWEDATLVVDTALFADHNSGNGRGVPSGPRKHLTERYSLSEDGTRMIVDILMEDPDYLAEPFEGRLELVYQPHLQLFRYNCEPER
jgi:hypothetical protein